MQDPGDGWDLAFLDAVLPFAAVIVFCRWQLWELRRSRPPKAIPFEHLPPNSPLQPPNPLHPLHASSLRLWGR